MLKEKIVGFHCLKTVHEGAHVSSRSDFEEWTKFVYRKDGAYVNKIVAVKSNGFEAEKSSLPVLRGTVSRPFHSFAGVQMEEAKRIFEEKYCC